MATLTQILSSKKQGRRQHWLVAGKEPALVQEAKEIALSHIETPELIVDKYFVHARNRVLEDVVEVLNQDSEADRSVVVLQDAQDYQGWEDLIPLLKKAPASFFFIAVYSAPAPATKEHWSRYFVRSTKTRMVTCDGLSPEGLSLWVNSRLRIEKDAENLLIQRSWGDYGWLLNQMRKLEMLKVSTITAPIVRGFCTTTGSPDYTVQMEKGSTSLKSSALTALTTEDLSTILPRLRSKLGLMVRVGAESRTDPTLTARKISEKLQVPSAEATRLWGIRANYGEQSTYRRLTALSRLYRGLRAGDKLAYLALTVRW